MGTHWEPIRERHGQSDQQAAPYFGNLWILRTIQRPEIRIDIRSSEERPIFPNPRINLSGKTYLLASGS